MSSTVVLLQSEEDVFLLRYARRLLKNNPELTIQIIDLNKLIATSTIIHKAIYELRIQFPSSVKVTKSSRFSSGLLSKYSFMLISYQAWNILSLSEKNELEYIPSTLIINKKVSRFHLDSHHKLVTNLTMDPQAEETIDN